MTTLDIRLLSDDHPFGSRICGVNRDNVSDQNLRQELRDVFEDRGMIVFEEMEPSGEMQVALSEVFGPPQDTFNPAVPRGGGDNTPGIIKISANPEDCTITEIDGELVSGYVGWHFDACYTEALNRGGVLRVQTIPPEGGMTGFADGIQRYPALSPEWREMAESLSIIYSQENMLHQQRFGTPKDFRVVRLQSQTTTFLEAIKNDRRAIHPAVWQRKTGEKVLHASPFQAAGIAGREDAEGDALLEAFFQTVGEAMNPYWHKWKPTDMAIWDNWRFIHSVSGYDPLYSRDAERTTIRGDYGLGCFEEDWKGHLTADA